MGRHARPLVPVTWQSFARCREEDPELFFAAEGEPREERVEREARAKAVCAICPVVTDCLTWSMRTRQRIGIWGGTTEDERTMMQRAARRTRTDRVPVG